MSAPTHDEFLKLFEIRRDHCRELLELSKRQAALIAEDDYERLFDVIARKQRVLERMEPWTQRQPRIRQAWLAARDGLSAEGRAQCEERLAEIESLLAELLRHERDGTDDLMRRRDATRRELAELAQSSRVHDSYRENLAPATHRHLDVGS